MSPIAVGDRVMVPGFFRGEVVSIDEDKVTVKLDDGGIQVFVMPVLQKVDDFE